MIPSFESGNVLPPFMGQDVAGVGGMPRSPYFATTLQLVERFALSRDRVVLLQVYLRFRQELRAIGLVTGFQWIDGSFVENSEAQKGRPPADIDVLTLVHRPYAHQQLQAWKAFLQQHEHTFFDPQHCKLTYCCDAYFVDLDTVGRAISEQSAYWFGLFSHQRDTFRWKGVVQVDLQCDDDAAEKRLKEISSQW